jgi:hypothetical protein
VYDRVAIETWFVNSSTDPLTGMLSLSCSDSIRFRCDIFQSISFLSYLWFVNYFSLSLNQCCRREAHKQNDRSSAYVEKCYRWVEEHQFEEVIPKYTKVRTSPMKLQSRKKCSDFWVVISVHYLMKFVVLIVYYIVLL